MRSVRVTMEQPTFAFSNDGSVTDVAAFRAALRSDPSKMQALQADPSAAAVLLDADDGALQAFLRETFQVRPDFRASAASMLNSSPATKPAAG